MPLLMQQILSTQDVDINKGVHYVYLDNDKRQPVSQGAVFLSRHKRGIGLRMKKAPGDERGAYWTDDEFDVNRIKVKEDIGSVENLLRENKIVVIVKSDLDECREDKLLEFCPRSYKYFRKSLAACLRIYGT